MDYSHVVNAVSNIVELACLLPANKFGQGIWNNHILEVVKYSEVLAINAGAHRDVVVLAALLHDYAGIVDYSLYEDHHVHSTKMAEGILSSLGYPQDRIEMVKQAIFTHRGSKRFPPQSIEARCVANADAMAHISRYDSLIQYAQHERGLSENASIQFVHDKINRSWKKMHSSVRKIFEVNYLRAMGALHIAA